VKLDPAVTGFVLAHSRLKGARPLDLLIGVPMAWLMLFVFAVGVAIWGWLVLFLVGLLGLIMMAWSLRTIFIALDSLLHNTQVTVYENGPQKQTRFPP
jgi:hypothetical protein